MKTIYVVVAHGYGTSETEFTSLTKALGLVSFLAKAGRHVELYSKGQ